jgi:hypothetical protein
VIGGLHALIAPLLATVEARLTVAATLAVRRAVLTLAATLFGVGALLFLSVGVFFGLLPGVGPAGAALVLALIWALLGGLCYVLSLVRPRRVRAPLGAARPVAPPVAPAVARPTAPTPAAGAYPRAHPAAGPLVDPVAVAAVPPRADLGAQLRRAAPFFAAAALLAGIFAGRR